MELDIKSPTIVTALYNIGRDKWEHFTSSYGGYLHWMERLLSVDCNIVIYIPGEFEDRVKELRRKYDRELAKTIIVIQELHELEAYKMFNDTLEELMTSDAFKSKVGFPDVPEMSKPLYNVIMFNKISWMRDCVNRRYFDNDAVIWMDAGGLRDGIKNYSGKTWPNIDKINSLEANKPTFFSHNDSIKIPEEKREYFSLSQIRNIQGTAFILPSVSTASLHAEFFNTVSESINAGYIGSDEKILDITYSKHPDWYSLIKSDWREYFRILE